MIGVTATGQVGLRPLPHSHQPPTQFRPLKAAFPRLRSALPSPLASLPRAVPIYLPIYTHTTRPPYSSPSSPPRGCNPHLIAPSIDPSHLCTGARRAARWPAGLLGRFPSRPYVPDLRSKEDGEGSHAGTGGGDGGRQPWRRRGGGAAPEPVRVAEAPGLAHLRPVPAQPPPAAGARAVQRRARARVPPLPRPVRQDQGPRQRLPLLRPPVAARALPVPAPPGLGQPRRARRTPPRRLRGARREARGQPLRSARRPPLPPRDKGLTGQGPRHRIREEAPEASAALVGPEGGETGAFATNTHIIRACSSSTPGESAGGGPRAGRAGAGPLLHPAPAPTPAALHARPFPHAGRRPPRRGRCSGEQLQRQQQRSQQWPQRRRGRRR